MTDFHELYDEALAAQIAETEAAEAADTAGESDGHGNRDAQVRAYEFAMVSEDRRADDLAGRQIGAWTVIGYKKNAQGRNVYIVKHRDGFLKGLRGYQLNTMLAAARRDGVIVR
jgi:hypothetical protein